MKWQNSKTVRGETGRVRDRLCVIWAPTETSGGFQIDVVSITDVSSLLFGSTVGCRVAASWNYISLNALALSLLFLFPTRRCFHLSLCHSGSFQLFSITARIYSQYKHDAGVIKQTEDAMRCLCSANVTGETMRRGSVLMFLLFISCSVWSLIVLWIYDFMIS